MSLSGPGNAFCAFTGSKKWSGVSAPFFAVVLCVKAQALTHARNVPIIPSVTPRAVGVFLGGVSSVGGEGFLSERMHYARLYDLYGTLLTEKQRRAFELHDMEDLSLSEIAELLGVSRQGAHDLLQRGKERLATAERTLRIDAREALWSEGVHSLKKLLEEFAEKLPSEFTERVESLLAELEDGFRVPDSSGGGKDGRSCLIP